MQEIRSAICCVILTVSLLQVLAVGETDVPWYEHMGNPASQSALDSLDNWVMLAADMPAALRGGTPAD